MHDAQVMEFLSHSLDVVTASSAASMLLMHEIQLISFRKARRATFKI